jgi:hypothetical protein
MVRETEMVREVRGDGDTNVHIIGSIVNFLVCGVRRIGQEQFSLYKYIYELYSTVLSPVRLKYTSDNGCWSRPKIHLNE